MPVSRSRRPGLAVALSALVTAALVGGATTPSAAGPGSGDRPGRSAWVATWGTALTGVPDRSPDYPDDRIAHLANQTVRQIVRTSAGGRELTIRLSNEHGDEPLQIDEAHVAVRHGTEGTAIRPATDRTVTFGGTEAVTIPAGGRYRSDPVDLDVPADTDIVVSIYLADPTPVSTVHQYSLQTTQIAAGNATGARSVTPVAETSQWLFLSGVSVRRRGNRSSIVTLGDSLTDGFGTTPETGQSWPEQLYNRLRADRRTPDHGIANAGIGGNRLLHDPNPPAGSPSEPYAAYFGPSALHRLETDVLTRPGIEYLIVNLGVNDLALPSSGAAPTEETVTAHQMIQGLHQLITRARAHGVTVYGATITPFKGAKFGFWSEEIEVKRQAVNEWIRSSGEYDAVIDFDAALRDEQDPECMDPAYDSGDHIHPNDAGARAMAEAVPLHQFRAPRHR